ncbi:hypothetical protein MGL_1520 [Malassezia globosa CBS 7966]|uniref:MPN domain-containing protein n=1 Tax=Malassezia globosa (strain ATCC MYA-4612 / CBS 7966) TaxID=425265 RepID=A8PXT4_MALGO|nr:uncharacterized protein MGL_1520 [Malassezia globosa CBS 7966]EDP44123.1 hypothetical protein MGL_1520 [Malassezia globosa CBS 7966]
MSKSASQSVDVSPLAYRKIVYHSAKYLSSTVVGVLVGTKSQSNKPNTTVTDIIPLVHHWHTLSPMTEAGMALVEAHLGKTGGTLLGLYEVPERLDQKIPSPTTTALAETLEKKTGTAPLVLHMNGAKLLEVDGAIHATVSGQSVQAQVARPEALSLALSQELDQGAWKFLYDWDDHLENTQLDWLTNPDFA